MSRIGVRTSFFYLILFMIILTSCKVTRKAIDMPIEVKNKSALLEDLKKNEFNFKTITAKATVALITGDKKSSIKASLKMRKDSAIWINFTYIGFAGARVLITKDSVKLINYRDSKYLLSDMNYINEMLNIDIDFQIIQSLLIGNSLGFDEGEKIRTAIDKNKYFLSSLRKRQVKRNRPEKKLDKIERKQDRKPDKLDKLAKKQERKEEKYKEQVHGVWLDAESKKVVKMLIKDYINNKELTANYGNFKETHKQLFPFLVLYKLSSDLSSEIKIDYSKVVADKPVRFVFNIPSKYEQISN